jgi:hypothetical protein
VTQDASHAQRTLILHLLQAAQPGWVPAPALARISLQYNARIFELRRAGWTISNRVATVGGKKHGSFRLGPPETPRSAELRVRVRGSKANSRLAHEVSAAIDRDDDLEARRLAATPSFPQFGALVKESYGVD